MLESHKENILIGRLLELYITGEWFKTIPHKAHLLTNINPPPQVINSANAQQKKLLINFIYNRYVRELPLFSRMGSKYLEELHGHLASFVSHCGVGFIVATKTDVHLLCKYYATLVCRLKKEAWHDSKQDQDPELLNDMNIWNRILVDSKATHGNFSLYHPVYKTIDLHPARTRKLARVSASIRRLLVSLKSTRAQILEDQKRFPECPVWWKYFGMYSLNTMPPVLQEFLDSFVSFAAHMYDNIMDDARIRHKVDSILARLPISVMVFTARFIDP